MDARTGSLSRRRVLAFTLIVTAVLLAGAGGLSRLAHADVEGAAATAAARQTAVAESTASASMAFIAVSSPAAASPMAMASPLALMALPAVPDPTFVARADLASLLPLAEDLPTELVEVSTERWSFDEVADSYNDPEEATSKLRYLGWDENIIRTFEADGGQESSADSTNYMETYIDRFVTPSAALAAMRYASSETLSGSAEDVSVPSIGNASRVLAGSYDDGERYAIVYAQWEELFIFIYASSPEGDPLPDAVAVARSIVQRDSA